MKKPPLPTELALLHEKAVKDGLETYIDPKTGLSVLTELAHHRRGSCCGSACRHCPYNWKNVPTSGMLLVVAWLLLQIPAVAQHVQPADTVARFTPGSGQNNGQGPGSFPANIFRGPSPRASDSVPDTDPREVCSIGLGGSITLGFRSGVVVDGLGADIVIHENAFRYGRGRVFAEPARVEVSRDGRTWTAFPFDSASLIGCAGVTPGGDAFDLTTIGVDSIRWIRITDITQMVLDNPKHKYYDPTLSGFDLDVVLGMYVVPAAFDFTLENTVTLTDVRIEATRATTMSVVDMRGTLLHQQEFPSGVHYTDVSWLPPGALLVAVSDGTQIRTLKVLR